MLRSAPPGLMQLVVAATGAAAVAFGLVALLNGRYVGIVIALGGAALLLWSILGRRVRR